MRSLFLFLLSMSLLTVSSQAQKSKTIIVKAGTKVIDYFPPRERYLYPDFVPGQVIFRTGKSTEMKLNYNILAGEIEFVQASDTFAITAARKKEIRYVVAQDTFIYAGAYIEIISGAPPKVGVKQYVRIKDVLKKGAYGTTSRGASIDTYNSLSSNGVSYDLVPNEDIEMAKETEYYITDQSGIYVRFTKKNVNQIYPDRQEEIKSYIKAHKVDFDSREDLLEFAGFLRTL